jgi:hypothetical protein
MKQVGTCAECGTPLYYSRKHQRNRRFCSRRCRYESQRKPLADRFFSRVGPADANGCLPWIGWIHPKGYGTLTVNDRAEWAHRLSYTLHRGDIPVGKFVCHTCDNRRCVNPEHLFLGTNDENMQDMVQKGRQSRGESPLSKLTAAQVLAIRSLYATSAPSFAAVAMEYGVSDSTIRNVVKRRSWTHI